MFVYEKKLQYPVKIKNANPRLAALIISQYGGPDGELGASLRYLSQRYSMPYPELKGLLTDIGTEELGHLEMIGTIVHQLTCNLSEKDIKTAGFDAYFVDHTAGIYPAAPPHAFRAVPPFQKRRHCSFDSLCSLLLTDCFGLHRSCRQRCLSRL